MFPYFPENHNLSSGTSGRTSENRGSNIQYRSFANVQNQPNLYNNNGSGPYTYLQPPDFIEPLCSVPISGRNSRNRTARVNQSLMQAARVSMGSSAAPSIAGYNSQDDPLISIISSCYAADPHRTLQVFNSFELDGEAPGGQATWYESSFPTYNSQRSLQGMGGQGQDDQATWLDGASFPAYNSQRSLQGMDGQTQGGQATWLDGSSCPTYNSQQPLQDWALYPFPSPVPRPSTTASTTSTYESSEFDTSSEGHNPSLALYKRSYSRTTVNTGPVSANCDDMTNSGTIDIGRLAFSFQNAGMHCSLGFFSLFVFPELSLKYRQQARPVDATDATEILFAVGDCPGVRLVDMCDQQVTIRDAGRKQFEKSGLKRIPFTVTFPGLTFPRKTLAIRDSANEYITRGDLAFNIACFILDYLKKLKRMSCPRGYNAPYGWDYKKVDINRLFIFSIYRLRNWDDTYDGTWCPSIGLCA